MLKLCRVDWNCKTFDELFPDYKNRPAGDIYTLMDNMEND